MMTFANNLDPDEAPQNVGPHLRSKLFETQIIHWQNLGLNQLMFSNAKEHRNRLSLLISMQRVKHQQSNLTYRYHKEKERKQKFSECQQLDLNMRMVRHYYKHSLNF